MSLTNVRLMNFVKKQYQYKLKSYIGVLSSIVVVQLIVLLLSSSMSSYSSGVDNVTISVDYYSASTVIGFSMLTVLINAIHITTKTFQEDGFTFVTNRLTANLSNILFLLAVSVFAGITAMLSSFLVRVGLLIIHLGNVTGSGWDISLLELTYGLGASIAFMLLAAAIGYIAGSIVQLSRLFMIILPVGLYGLLVLNIGNDGEQLGETIFKFFFQEPSFSLLWFKVVVTAAVLFACSLLITNNKEVRQ